jgi:hypothetical protein
VIYVTAYPYLAARLQQVVWAHTTLDDVRFRTEIAARPLFRLVLKNVLLTIVTFGLYGPFAAVAIARYRVPRRNASSGCARPPAGAGASASPTRAGGPGLELSLAPQGLAPV